MGKGRFSEEQIINVLKEHRRVSGLPLAEFPSVRIHYQHCQSVLSSSMYQWQGQSRTNYRG
jgi:hypothetical protein